MLFTLAKVSASSGRSNSVLSWAVQQLHPLVFFLLVFRYYIHMFAGARGILRTQFFSSVYWIVDFFSFSTKLSQNTACICSVLWCILLCCGVFLLSCVVVCVCVCVCAPVRVGPHSRTSSTSRIHLSVYCSTYWPTRQVPQFPGLVNAEIIMTASVISGPFK